jgi:hypothetical protein
MFSSAVRRGRHLDDQLQDPAPGSGTEAGPNHVEFEPAPEVDRRNPRDPLDW